MDFLFHIEYGSPPEMFEFRIMGTENGLDKAIEATDRLLKEMVEARIQVFGRDQFVGRTADLAKFYRLT